MFTPGIIQGRPIGEKEIEQVRGLIAGHPEWPRRRISEQLARLWDWYNPAGQLKDMAARTLLLKLERRGWITLPPRRRPPVHGKARRSPVESDLLREQAGEEVRLALGELQPLGIEEISRERQAGKQAEFSRLLERHHDLGHRGTVGENLQYLVSDGQGHALACVLFGSGGMAMQSTGWNTCCCWFAASLRRPPSTSSLSRP